MARRLLCLFNDFGLASKLHKKDFKKAKESYEMSIMILPSEEAWTNLGSLYHQVADYGKAINCYNQALKLNPDNLNPAVGIFRSLIELHLRFKI